MGDKLDFQGVPFLRMQPPRGEGESKQYDTCKVDMSLQAAMALCRQATRKLKAKFEAYDIEGVTIIYRLS